jgi:hypothetical protein
MPTIDPVAAALSFQWSREKGVRGERSAIEDKGIEAAQLHHALARQMPLCLIHR